MSKCIILSRVSTLYQELDSQTARLLDEAHNQGYTDDDIIIIENKESAIKLKEEERLGLQRMKENIEKNPDINHIFIYELSRLSRRQLDLFSIRDYLIERKIQLTCCTPYFRMLEDGKLSQTANLMFSIFASMAESEMELKKERMLRGRQRNRMTGKIAEGRPLIGYKVDVDKRVIIDDEKKDFIIDMFTLYSTGLYSIKRLSDELIIRHPEYADNPQRTRNNVAYLIRCERYCGDEKYPQLISRELFEKCRNVAKKNNSENKYFEQCDALLKKLIFSKKSGNHMTFKAIKGGHRYEAPHEKPMIACLIKNIDEHVWQLAVTLHKTYIKNEDKLKKNLKQKQELTRKKMMNTQILESRLKEKIDRIEERLIYGKLSQERADSMTKEIQMELLQTQNDRKKLSEELNNITHLIDKANHAEMPDYQHFSYEEKIGIIREVIKRIELEKITYRDFRAWVTTNVDDFMYIIDFNNYTGSFSLTTKAMFVKP